jgi:hypothetical protein
MLLRDGQPLRFPVVPYAKKIVLHTPKGYSAALDALVAQFIKDGVTFVGIVGKDCSKIEDIVDELCVGDGSNAYDMPQQAIRRNPWNRQLPLLVR